MALEGDVKITLTRASSGASLTSSVGKILSATSGAGMVPSPRSFLDFASSQPASPASPGKSPAASPATSVGMPERMVTVEQGLQKLHSFCSNLKKVSVSLSDAIQKLEKKLHGDIVEETVARKAEFQELINSERAARQEHASSVQKLLASEKAARASHEGMIRGLLGSQEVTFLGHLTEQRNLLHDQLEERAGKQDEELIALRERVSCLEAYLQVSLGERKQGSFQDTLRGMVIETCAGRAPSKAGSEAAEAGGGLVVEQSALMELLRAEKAARENLEDTLTKQLAGLEDKISVAVPASPTAARSTPWGLETELQKLAEAQVGLVARVESLQGVVEDCQRRTDDAASVSSAAPPHKATAAVNGNSVGVSDVQVLQGQVIAVQEELPSLRDRLQTVEDSSQQTKTDYAKLLEEMLCVSSTLGMMTQERKAEEKRLWTAIDTHTHDLPARKAASGAANADASIGTAAVGVAYPLGRRKSTPS